jgi:hypothetical protein
MTKEQFYEVAKRIERRWAGRPIPAAAINPDLLREFEALANARVTDDR